jgi:hypothetical protein
VSTNFLENCEKIGEILKKMKKGPDTQFRGQPQAGALRGKKPSVSCPAPAAFGVGHGCPMPKVGPRLYLEFIFRSICRFWLSFRIL